MSAEPRSGTPRGMPERIGRYRIVGRLGRGAMGVVYGARDDAMDRQVAIKVLMPDLEGEPDIRERFMREARIAGQLMHRNVVTVYDIGEEDGRLYIVMEQLKGMTLGQHLKQLEAPDLEQSVDLMMQVCEGLAAAHARGVVHRDLKPGNIFVLPDGSAKILDFGVARLVDSSMTASGLIVGTPDYMSPEQARGREVDHRSDIFSMGAVFYQMLSGRRPFAAADLPAVLHKVEHENPGLLEQEAPAELDQIVRKALAKDPARRYQHVAELLGDLVRFRRRYETESRGVALTASDHYQAAEALVNERLKAAAQLDAELPPSSHVRFAKVLSERYPGFAEHGARTLQIFPFKRARVHEILNELQEAHRALASEMERVRRAAAGLERADASLALGDNRGAVRVLESVIADVPESARARRALERAQRLIVEQREREAQLAAHLTRARDFERAGDWIAVVAACDAAIALEPSHTEAVTLRMRASKTLEREADRRRQVVEKLLSRAELAIQNARFDAAARCLDEARIADPTSERAIELVADLARARRAAEELERGLAGTEADEKHWDDAPLKGRESNEAAGVDEINRVSAARLKVASAEKQQSRALAQVRDARASLGRGDLRSAMTITLAALRATPAESSLRKLQQEILVRLRELADTAGTDAEAARWLSRAREELARGRYRRARRLARLVLGFEPANAAAADLLAEAAHKAEDARALTARERTERRRAAGVASAFVSVRAAFQVGDLRRARQGVARALALDPDNAAIRTLSDVLDAGSPSANQGMRGDPSGPVAATTRSAGLGRRLGDIRRRLRLLGEQTRLRTQALVRRAQSMRGHSTPDCLMLAGVAALSLLVLLPGARHFVPFSRRALVSAFAVLASNVERDPAASSSGRESRAW